jgi:hypothetical protein
MALLVKASLIGSIGRRARSRDGREVAREGRYDQATTGTDGNFSTWLS